METQPTEQQPLTHGQKAAGVSFNPSKDPAVDSIKTKFAALIDEIHEARLKSSGEKARYFSTAITNAEISQMLAVKALTWQH